MSSFPVYAAAALAEIGGCFAFWAWLRLGKPVWWLIPGTVSLLLFPYLLTLAMNLLADAPAAEDVVQEALMKAYRQLDRFESRAEFGTWLHRIGVNCALDHLRSRKVLEQLPHVLLVGAGAARFAREMGFAQEDLLTPDSQRAWEERLAAVTEGEPNKSDGPLVRLFPEIEERRVLHVTDPGMHVGKHGEEIKVTPREGVAPP